MLSPLFTLRRPPPPPPPGHDPRFADWVLLDTIVRGANHDWEGTSIAQCAASLATTARTSMDVKSKTESLEEVVMEVEVEVSFFFVSPPEISGFIVHLGDSGLPYGATVVGTDGDAVLIALDIPLLNLERYLVYKVEHGNPSLEVLPYPPTQEFPSTGAVGILTLSQGYVVAALLRKYPIDTSTTNISFTYELLLYFSKTKIWSSKVIQLERYRQADLNHIISHRSTKVIKFGLDSLGWVDLWHGIVYCKLLKENPELRFFNFPGPMSVNANNYGELPPRAFRDVICTGNTVRLIEVEYNQDEVIKKEDKQDEGKDAGKASLQKKKGKDGCESSREEKKGKKEAHKKKRQEKIEARQKKKEEKKDACRSADVDKDMDGAGANVDEERDAGGATTANFEKEEDARGASANVVEKEKNAGGASADVEKEKDEGGASANVEKEKDEGEASANVEKEKDEGGASANVDYVYGWKATPKSRTIGQDWKKDLAVDSGVIFLTEDSWGLLSKSHSLPDDVLRAYPLSTVECFAPTLGIGDNLYMMSRALGNNDKPLGLLAAVDMKNKNARLISFSTERVTYVEPNYLPCTVSRYFNNTPGNNIVGKNLRWIGLVKLAVARDILSAIETLTALDENLRNLERPDEAQLSNYCNTIETINKFAYAITSYVDNMCTIDIQCHVSALEEGLSSLGAKTLSVIDKEEYGMIESMCGKISDVKGVAHSLVEALLPKRLNGRRYSLQSKERTLQYGELPLKLYLRRLAPSDDGGPDELTPLSVSSP